MRIALITDSIDEGSPGLRTYTMGLTRGLLALDGDHQVTLIHRRAGPFYMDKPHLRVDGFGGKALRKLALLPLRLSGHGFDLVHDTYHFPPFLGPVPYARVVTIGDLTSLVLDTHIWRLKLAHRLLVRPLARRADQVVTFSEHSRKDIARLLDIPLERISVTYPAAPDTIRPVRDRRTLTAVRERYGLPEDFLLFVGTLEPRKNVRRLIKAFGRAAPALPGTALALVGPQGWRMSDPAATAEEAGVSQRVVVTGPVPDDELAALYSAATALVYPSLYEGFGLPPLEAMRCGCPVITSNVSSLPEVTGDAAVLVDPCSLEELAEAMVRVVNDRSLREELAERGEKRARRFTWERCARDTLAAYRRAGPAA